MSPLFYTILTDAGASLISKSQADGTALRILEGSVGTSPRNPETSDTAISEERYRAPLKGLKKLETGSVLEIEFEVPADQGGWPIHTIGIYGTTSKEEDAAADTLIAIAKLSGAFKPLPSDGAGSISTYKIFLVVSSTANINLNLPPGNTAATQEWVGKAIEAAVKETKEALFPVGSYYHTDSTKNPAELLGFGFWQRIQGRLLVGYDPGQTEFNPVGKQAGSKLLETAHLPQHAHGMVSMISVSRGQPLPDAVGKTPRSVPHIAVSQWGGSSNGEYELKGVSVADANSRGFGGLSGPALTPDGKPISPSPALPPYRVTNIWVRSA